MPQTGARCKIMVCCQPGETHVGLAAAPLNIVTPLTLEGAVVRLVPIRHEHAELFCEAAKHDLGNIFRWIPYPMRTLADFQLLVEKAFGETGTRRVGCLR